MTGHKAPAASGSPLIAGPRVRLFYALPSDVLDAAAYATCDAILTPDERARRDRFVFDKNKREFLVTRALARTVLGAYTGRPREAVRFSIGEFGKPSLEPPQPNVAFNLSNAVTFVVCAVTSAPTIGVDVESFARADQVHRVASDVFTAAEQAEVALLHPDARDRRVVELWTAKEAYMKARGLGMSLPPSSFAMSGFALSDDPRPPDEPDRSRWSFVGLEVEGHCITVCVEARDLTGAAVDVERVDVRRALKLST